MSEMEKTYFQRFALSHINKKAENSPENGLLTVSLKRIFPGMPKRLSGCAIQGSDYKKQPQACATNRFEADFYGAREGTWTPTDHSTGTWIQRVCHFATRAGIAPRGDSSVMRKRVASVSRMNRLEQYRAEVSFSQNSRRKLLMYFMTGFLPGKTAILSIFSKLPRISFSGISNSIQWLPSWLFQ